MKPLPQKHDTASVFGVGRSGRALITHLVSLGVEVYAFDDAKSEDLADIPRWLASLGVPLFAGGGFEARGDFVFRTPAMRPDAPVLCRAALRGASVMGEAEYFARLCPAPIYAVSGSDGKTTTATMLAGLLSATGKRVYLGGNIGRSLLPFLSEMTPNDACVLELSSFQLSDMEAHFHTGVLTNLSPNHLNWHKSMAEYTAAKRRLAQMSERRVLRAGLFPEYEAVRFSVKESADFCLRDGVLCGHGIPLCGADTLRVRGEHNMENLLAASAACADCVTPHTVKDFASRFGGVAHRMEWVRSLRGVRFINSSIDTTPSRTAATLAATSAQGTIHLLLGGRGKGLSLSPLLCAAQGRDIRFYLFGEMRTPLALALSSARLSFCQFDSMPEAVAAAYEEAKEGDTVLLSPSATAYDAYVDYEARGDAFRQAVAALKA